MALIKSAGAEIAYGPFDQPDGGNRGRREGTSVDTRDPDGNLIEFMTYPAAGRGGRRKRTATARRNPPTMFSDS